MRKLEPCEIESLASRPGVRRIAVENFLSSLPLHVGISGQHANLAMDAMLYRWNSATVKAIRDGIRRAAN